MPAVTITTHILKGAKINPARQSVNKIVWNFEPRIVIRNFPRFLIYIHLRYPIKAGQAFLTFWYLPASRHLTNSHLEFSLQSLMTILD